MTNAVIAELESVVAKIKAEFTPQIKTAENDLKAIGASALSYIESNGLTALYSIATAALSGAATGTPFTSILADVVTQGEAAGITIAKGAEAVVVAQAQADLVAAGSLASPSTGVVIAPVVAPVAGTASSASGTSA
jgi:phage host-nuclease inhibitor protein Gam